MHLLQLTQAFCLVKFVIKLKSFYLVKKIFKIAFIFIALWLIGGVVIGFLIKKKPSRHQSYEILVDLKIKIKALKIPEYGIAKNPSILFQIKSIEKFLYKNKETILFLGNEGIPFEILAIERIAVFSEFVSIGNQSNRLAVLKTDFSIKYLLTNELPAKFLY